MTRRLWPSLALLLLIVAALLWRGLLRPGDKLEYYAPQAYVARAAAIIDKGYLRADCRDEPIRIVADFEAASELEQAFYENSYLADDVERFNRDPEAYGWTFLIDDACALRGVNPVVHAVPLPFSDHRRWRGWIFFRGHGTDVALRSAQRTVALRRPRAVVPAGEVLLTTVGAGDDVVDEQLMLHFGGGLSNPAARVRHVGERAVVDNLIKRSADGAMKLMGHQLPTGRIFWLDQGDWLHLTDGGRHDETFVYTGGDVHDVASAVQQRNATYERNTADEPLGWVDDPSRDLPQKYLDVLASNLGNALEALPEERATEPESGFDLQLTVDRQLQTDLDRIFRGFCRRQRSGQKLNHPFSAGLTVMDGRSGELLALVTFPHPQDLEETPPADSRRRRRLLLNQNFVRHPIGSAGKPFFYAAIAETHPFLLDLELDPHLPEELHRDLLQCRLDLGYQLLDGHFGPIDFPRALEMSCNKFTVELATLALAARRGAVGPGLQSRIPRDDRVPWPRSGQTSGIRIDGRPLGYAPDLRRHVDQPRSLAAGVESTAVSSCRALTLLEAVPFRDPFERITGAATYGGLDPNLAPDATTADFYRGYVTGRYDLRPLRPLIEHLITGEDPETAWDVRAALQAISPERVNLAFNHATDLRLHYVTMLLGGGSSLWSNIQLTEALSRLVTGRAVESRLIAEVLPRGGPDPGDGAAESRPPTGSRTMADPIAIKERVRRQVLEGMTRVVSGAQGTAKTLRPGLREAREARPDQTVHVFAKTGSPRILRPVPGATAETLRRLLRQRHLVFDGDRIAVEIGPRVTSHEPRDTPGRAAFVGALDEAIRRVGYRAGGGLSQTIRRVVDNFQSQRQDLARASAERPAEARTPPRFCRVPVVSDRILFVLEVTSSTRWPHRFPPRRIEALRAQVSAILEALPEETTFNILLYGDNVHAWRKAEVAATKPALAKAWKWVEKRMRDPEGRAGVHAALERAFLGFPKFDTLFFVTDDLPNHGRYITPEGICASVRAWNRHRRAAVHAITLNLWLVDVGLPILSEDHYDSEKFVRALAKSSGGTAMVLERAP